MKTQTLRNGKWYVGIAWRNRELVECIVYKQTIVDHEEDSDFYDDIDDEENEHENYVHYMKYEQSFVQSAFHFSGILQASLYSSLFVLCVFTVFIDQKKRRKLSSLRHSTNPQQHSQRLGVYA